MTTPSRIAARAVAPARTLGHNPAIADERASLAAARWGIRMTFALTGLEGKVAIVTGAGRMRSIGRRIALGLAHAGCDLVLTGTGRAPTTYPDDEQAVGWRDVESVAEEVRAIGVKTTTATCDISDEASVESLRARVLAEHGRIDVLVNNASAAPGEDRAPLIDLPVAQWKRVMDVNLTGTFLMSKVFAAAMVDAGQGGAIVNISSIVGKMAPPNFAALAASKAGIHAMTACLAQELGPQRVRVNSICPGLVNTPRVDQLSQGPGWDQFVSGFVPLGRVGTGDDIANAVVFLCSNEGGWITGQAWNVDGGSATKANS
jgi:3-oxoacyl-[acyl-carrier protein] reductase